MKEIGAWRSPASALAWGARGPGFNSRRPDQPMAPAATRERDASFCLWHADAVVVQFYVILAAVGLAAHVLWIVWVILGTLLTRGRRSLVWFHIDPLVYTVVIDAGPWPYPLTAFEQSLQAKAGMTPYRQGCVIHYLEALVYRDVPQATVTPRWRRWS